MKLKILALTAIVAMVSQNSFALTSGALGNEIISTEQLSKGGATVAGTAKDPIVVYSQPASIGDMGNFNVTAGVNYLTYGVEKTGANGAPNDEMLDQSIVIPNFGVSKSFQDGKFGVGLAVVSPYGLSTEWKQNSDVRYIATNSLIEILNITPAASYRFNDKLSIGAGLDYFQVSDAILEKKVVNFTGADANSKLTGDGDQWGYHTGVVYKPWEKHQFGLVYHSQINMRIEGDLELTQMGAVTSGALGLGGVPSFKADAKTDLFLPQNIQLGYAFIPSERWQFEFDAAWYDWSKNRELLVLIANAPQLNSVLPLEWKDVWTLGGHTTFNPDNPFEFNLGFWFIHEAVPDHTFTPILPDSDRLGITLGTTYTHSRFKVDLLWNPIFYSDRTISNNALGTTLTPLNTAFGAGAGGTRINGEYGADINIVGLNVSYYLGNGE